MYARPATAPAALPCPSSYPFPSPTGVSLVLFGVSGTEMGTGTGTEMGTEAGADPTSGFAFRFAVTSRLPASCSAFRRDKSP